MSLALDPNRPWTDEEKEWCRNSGRASLIVGNERRFGVDGKGETVSGEESGSEPVSPHFGQEGVEARQAAVYDVGGAPLPGTTLDVDTGRLYGGEDDEGNGVLVEPSLPVNPAGAFANPSPWGETHDEGDVDDDITEEVLAIPNMEELKKRLKKEKVDFPSGANREELEDLLAIKLHDKRHGTESNPGAPVPVSVKVNPVTGQQVN